MKNSVNILGTKYSIEIHKISEDTQLEENSWAGYCDEDAKRIVLADLDEEKYFAFQTEKDKNTYAKKTLRHEILHAFLNESGLSDSSLKYNAGWAKNEEMVDWFAIQYPKIASIYKELNIID